MLHPCSNDDCGASFADDLLACPVCGAPNDDGDDPLPAETGMSHRLTLGQIILLSFLATFMLCEIAILVNNVATFGLGGLIRQGSRIFLTILLGSWLYQGSTAARSVVIFLSFVSGALMLYLIHFSQLTASATGVIPQFVAYFYLLFAVVLIVPSCVTEFLTYQWEGKR